MNNALWTNCLQRLEQELSDQQLNTWIRPLQVREDNHQLTLLAPNRFVLDWVKQNFRDKIENILLEVSRDDDVNLLLEIGTQSSPAKPAPATDSPVKPQPAAPKKSAPVTDFGIPTKVAKPRQAIDSNLNPAFTFESFVEGKSNQLAKAASQQVAENPGEAYNPLFLYGGVGLGKTHLMHAVGNMMIKHRPDAKVVYLHSERFVGHMIKALQHNAIDAFKQYYRSLDCMLIDDIQFFAGKERSQEEFFHTFNALLEGGHQIILTCDRYPKEVDGLE